MKKIICAILCLGILLGVALPVLADEIVTYTDVEVRFTDDSSFQKGGTVTVDKFKLLDDGDITSEVYNAILEGRAQYYWFCNGYLYKDGTSITFTQSEVGFEFYCQVTLYSDIDHTEQFGVLYSEKFMVTGGDDAGKVPEITTSALPDGRVGEAYYFRLECSDPDAVFSLYQSSLPAGLYITQHGEIEGTPTQAGAFHVNIMAIPDAGEYYAAMKSFEITITDGPRYSMEILHLPNKLTYMAGETLDMTGLQVRIIGPDGYFFSTNGDGLTYSKSPLVTVGEQKIKLTYEDAFEVFYVKVLAAPEATEETTAATTEQTETTEAPETTEATVPEQTETTEEPVLTVGTAPTEPAEDTDGAGDGWIFWVVVGICALLLLASAAVIVVLFVTKRKKAN